MCNFADAFYFITTGNKLFISLLGLDKTNAIAQLLSGHGAVSASVQTMVSTSLIERLLVDGPVFPFYLGFVQFISGINLLADNYHLQWQIFSIANSILDSLTCVLVYLIGRFIFSRTVALLAGFLFALYPPSIVNTAICYSEQFAYFLLSLWIYLSLCFYTTARHPHKFRNGIFVSLSLGIITGLIMLVKPVFVLLPPLVLLVLFLGSWFFKNKDLSFVHRCFRSKKYVCLASIAFLCIIFSWSCFTKAATGKFSLFVNRVPAFNFYIGNNSDNDGWRTYPIGYIPTTSSEAVNVLASQFKSNPSNFINLELRKIARLWAAPWNIFNYKFILGTGLQKIFHQVLLFLAYLGTLMLLFSKDTKNAASKKIAGCLLASTILFHFVYLAFEPLSRYAITAMPFVVLLAAHAISIATKTWRAAITSLILIVCFLVVSRENASEILPWLGFISNTLEILLPAVLIIGCITWTIFAIALYLYWLKPSIEDKSHKTVKTIIALSSLLGFLISSAYSTGATNILNWKIRLKNDNSIIRQEIQIPKISPVNSSANVLLLLDINSNEITPRATIKVNDHTLNAQLSPLWQITDSKELLGSLAIQARAMGTSVQKFRQWWTVAIPPSYLNFGGNNTITIQNTEKSFLVLHGDYPTGKKTILPSFTEASWTKGFNTVEGGDARLNKEIALSNSAVKSAWFDGSNWNNNDLSNASGEQFGRYRIYLAINTNAMKDPNSKSITLFKQPDEKEILGGNPVSMYLTTSPIAISQAMLSTLPDLANTKFIVSLEAKSDNKSTTYTNIDWSGTSNNNKLNWISPWQPGCVRLNNHWQNICFSDVIPKEILLLNNLNCSIMTAPFHAELLFLNHKKAIKQKIYIRNFKLELISSPAMPSFDTKTWSIY